MKAGILNKAENFELRQIEHEESKPALENFGDKLTRNEIKLGAKIENEIFEH